MELKEPKRSKTSARERQMARKKRRQEQRTARKKLPDVSHWLEQARLDTIQDTVRDLLWTIRSQPGLGRNIGLAVAAFALIYLFTYTLTGRIYPRVSSLGVNLGGLSTEAAADTLQQAWQSEAELTVLVDGETYQTLRPSQLGFQLDATATAERAREEVNWREGFFGVRLEPVVTLPDAGFLLLQNYLLDIAPEVNTAALNAGFAWQDGLLVAVPGSTGQLLDIAPTLAAAQADPAAVIRMGQLEVSISPVQPEVMDASDYLAEANLFLSQSLNIEGYDPYRDELMQWSTDNRTVASWLEVNEAGLALRRSEFAPFLEAQNASLNTEEGSQRYLDVQETMEAMQQAILEKDGEVTLRIRYAPETYVVRGGESAYGIARKNGIPYYMVERQNPGRDLNILSPGDTVKLPTRDVTMPNDPVPGKRIIVDLDGQELWAYENGEVVFNWSISSGRGTAPTSPGIYQILNHDPLASGSSYTLCSDLGCGQWEMSWFMGIYEVVPGLVNGFHGSVLLPNGTYLNGGSVGFPSTFGCVMSPDEAARELYEWAEVGTVVEIISSEFEPMSSLAVRTQQA